MNTSAKIFIVGIVSLLTSCNSSPINAPTPVLTPNSLIHNPPYLHYSSQEEFDIHLEFDYPDYWTIYEDNSPGFVFINLTDSRVLIYSTQDPNQPHTNADIFSKIYIWTYTPQTNETYISVVSDFQHLCLQENPKVKFIDNYQIIIDEIDANVVECMVQNEFDYSSFEFARKTIFQVENQIYVVDLTLVDNELRNQFEQGYDYFLNSIKITP